MAQLNNLTALSAEEQQSLDNVLECFGNVWKPGELERWLDWLPEPESPLRVPMLLGMARIDMQHHWQQGQRPTVESYLQRFPELGEDNQSETQLIQSEYQARCQAGLRVDVAQMARRFDRSPEDLQQLLGLPATVVEEDDPATRLIAKPQTQEDEQATRLIARSQVQAASRTLAAPEPVPSIRRPRRRWLGGVVAGISVLLTLLAVGAAVVYLKTDHGTVQIELNDPGAQVSIELDNTIVLNDGEKSIRLRAGEHGLVVKGKDHQTTHKSFTVRRGKITLVRVTLKKKPHTKGIPYGTVRIQLSEPKAKVNLRLDQGDEIKEPEKPLRLPVGKHTLVVTGKEYETLRKTFTVREGKTTLVSLALNKKASIDLLARVDVQRDALLGQWKREGKTLRSSEEGRSLLQVPYALPAEYDLTLLAQRTVGQDALFLSFEVQNRRVRLVLDGVKATMSGMGLVDRKPWYANETTWKGQGIPQGKPVRIDLSARKDRIKVVCGGQTVIDWKGRLSSLRDFSGLPCSSCLVLGSEHTAFRVLEFSIRPVSQPRDSNTRATTPDQIVARHVLFRGGAVQVSTQGKEKLQCRHLGDLPTDAYRLRAVTLDRGDLSWDQHLPHLPAVAALEVWRADHADLGDAEIAHLGKFTGLRELSVAGTRITDRALPDLSKLTQLRLLRVAEGQFSQKALQQFRANLPKCQIEQVPADRVAAEAILNPNEVFRLHPARVTLRTADGKKRTVGSVSQLPPGPFQVLALSGPQLATVPGWRLKGLRNLPQLESLFFWSNAYRASDWLLLRDLPQLRSFGMGWNGINEEGVRHLSGFEELRSLSLIRTACTDPCLKHLKNLKHLISLTLEAVPVTDAGIKHLADISTLQRLNLDDTRISDASIEQLAKMKALRELRIRRTRLTKEGVDRLRKALPRCKVIAE